MAKILLVDDHNDHNQLVKSYIAKQQHTIEVATTGQEALDKLAVSEFDIIVLDWNLPDMTGIDVLRWYRQKGQAPVIMLTGEGSIAHREEGLDSGADDYLVKPFSVRELLARIRALLRRPSGLLPESLTAGRYRLVPDTLTVRRESEEIRLQPREFALLEFLARHPNQVFSGDALLRRIWPSESETTTDAVRTTVKKIRQKLDEKIIDTASGGGYKLGS